VICGGGRLRQEFQRWIAAREAVHSYDVLHFNFGSSILSPRVMVDRGRFRPLRRLANLVYFGHTELRDAVMAARAGKVVCATFQGDDIRQGDICRERYRIHFAHEVEQGYYSATTDQWKRERAKSWDESADHLFAISPDLLSFLPRRARLLPKPQVDLDRIKPFSAKPVSDEPHLVHAPTHRLVKGTGHLLRALDRLRGDGVRFRLTLVEGMSHDAAMAAYRSADLAVDQLLAGWYGGFAIEMMAMGVPVMAYLREEDMHHLPVDMRADLPVINADPETVEERLRAWLTTRKNELPEIGARSRRFVERWHDPRQAAALLQRLYKESWLAKQGKPSQRPCAASQG
jgi:hypothetical protein